MRAFLIFCLCLMAGGAGAEPSPDSSAPIAMPSGASSIHFDESMRRLYVPADAAISIYDAALQEAGHVEIEKATGLVLALPLRRGYALDAAHDTLAIFDPATQSIVARQKLDLSDPQAMAFEPRTTRLAIFGQEKTLLLDAAGDKDPVSLDLGGVTMAVADGSGALFAIDGKNEIEVIDAKRDHIAAWALPSACGGAVALALDDKDRHLFVACKAAKLVSLDSDYGRAETMLDLAAPAGALAYDTAAGRLFALGGGTLTAIGPTAGSAGNAFTILATMPVDAGAGGLTLDQQGHRLFTLVPNPDSPDGKALEILSDNSAATQ